MGHITVSRTLTQPADKVWQTLTDLEALPGWNDTCSRVEVDGEGAEARRRVWLQNGHELRESFHIWDARRRRMGFVVEGMPAPFSGMEMTMQVDGDEAGCTLTWEADYSLRGGLLGAAADILALRTLLRREHGRILGELESFVAQRPAVQPHSVEA